MDIKATADKYIGEDGSTPIPAEHPVKQIAKAPERLTTKQLDDVTEVTVYLAFQNPNDIWGGRRNHEVWEAWCRLLKIPNDQFGTFRAKMMS